MDKKLDGFAARKKGFEGVDGVIVMDDETLHRLQNFLFQMLQEIVAVLEKHHIFYTLSGGSVLGSVRHSGFIPWDDDIDINMPRAEFEKLKQIFQQELGEKYTLEAPELGHEHGMTASQIKCKNTIFRSYNELSKTDCGICIDIFVIENCYDSSILRKLHGYMCLAYGYALTCKKTYHDYPFLKPFMEQSERLRKEFSKKIRMGRLMPFVSLDRIAARTMSWYSKCKNDHSKYVSIPSGKLHYFGEMYLREDMCESIWGTFEGMQVRLPKNSDRYLSILYGKDYMKIPEEGHRERHPFMELDFGDQSEVSEDRG